MTTTVHKNMTGADLHEPKGADTASVDTVYVANGAGSGSWVAASSVITNTAFTTGDLKPTHKTSADTSWILWSDGTIGDGSSSASIRANADTAALFAVYWNGYTNTLCPVSSGRGVSAAADFAAHKTISLPIGAGRALGLAGSGSGLTTRGLGGVIGNETKTILTANLPPYTPAGTLALTKGTLAGIIGNTFLTSGAGSQGGSGFFSFTANPTVTITGAPDGNFAGTAQGGTSTAFNVMNPTSYVNIMIKL